jgi:hypothetical protein
MKTKKTNKMNPVVSINWKIKDLIREKLSFANWHKTVFGRPASRKVLSEIKAKGQELVEMKQAMLLAATDEAAA